MSLVSMANSCKINLRGMLDHIAHTVVCSTIVGCSKACTTDVVTRLAGQAGILGGIDMDVILKQMCVMMKQSKNVYYHVGVQSPIKEELMLRLGVQYILLKRIPEVVMGSVSPRKKHVLDSDIAKIARVLFTAISFSACHLFNRGLYPDGYVNAQLISGFLGGVAYGTLLESKAGLLGAIVAHITNNALGTYVTLCYC